MIGAVDRSSPLPLWAQISDDLRARLLAGDFEEHFPTDDELTRSYGVSRHTAREAVRKLSEEGLLRRQRGRGTRLARSVLEQPLHSMYSLASSISAQGLEERSEVIRAEIATCPPEGARLLRLTDANSAVYVERLRFAGDEPIAWDRSWLVVDVAEGLLDVDLTSGSIYDFLWERCSTRVTGGWERVSPVLARPGERRRLRLPEGVALFSMERLAMAGDAPVEWRRTLIRGDRYCLVASWPAGSSASG